MSSKRSGGAVEGKPASRSDAESAAAHGDTATSRTGRLAWMAAHLARAPLVLVVTVLAAIPVVYFTAQPSFVKGIAPRWQIPDDLLYFTSYCLVIVAILSVLVRLSAPRYVLVILTVAWTTILFGPGAVVTVGAVGVTAYLLGASLLNRSAGDSRGPWPVPLAFALGYAVLLGLFQAGVVIGLYNRFVVVLVVSVVCWLSRARLVADSARLRAWIVEPMSGGWWSIAPLLIISIQLVYASFAETHSDALAIHLMIPHQISMIGTWRFDAATYTFAVMPKGANWLFTAHYLLAGESAARLFNATATFMTGWLVFDVVRRQVGREAGALLAAMFLSAPLTFWAVFVMFEDAVVTLFTTTAVVLLMWTWRNQNPKEMSLVALAVSAVIATKLQGLLMTIPIALVLGVNLVRTGSLASIRAGCLRMAVPVLAIGIVPYAVAWFRTGNPLFPFYNAFFRSPFFAPINFVDRRWMGKGSVDLLYALTFHTSTFMEGVDGGFGFQHVLLVPSVLVAVLLIRRAEVVIPAFCGAGMFLLSVTFTQYARYLYPTFPLLALASAAVWSRAVAERWRSLLVCCLCVLIALHLYFYRSVNYFYSFYPPTPLAAQPRPQPAYPSEREFNAIVNATYGRTARVLYLGRPWAAGLDGTPLFAIEQLNSDNYAGLTAVKDVEGLKALLKRHGVTHVITSDEMTPPAKFPILGEFLPRAATLVARNADARLWRVGSPEIGLERTIDFGSIRVGEAGAQTLTVSNQGTADLTIADITLAGPGQDQYRRPGDKDSCSGTTLPPERSCTVMVRLKPTQPGTVHATLEIASNDPNQRIINVTLNGTGTP